MKLRLFSFITLLLLPLLLLAQGRVTVSGTVTDAADAFDKDMIGKYFSPHCNNADKTDKADRLPEFSKHSEVLRRTTVTQYVDADAQSTHLT